MVPETSNVTVAVIDPLEAFVAYQFRPRRGLPLPVPTFDVAPDVMPLPLTVAVVVDASWLSLQPIHRQLFAGTPVIGVSVVPVALVATACDANSVDAAAPDIS